MDDTENNEEEKDELEYTSNDEPVIHTGPVRIVGAVKAGEAVEALSSGEDIKEVAQVPKDHKIDFEVKEIPIHWSDEPTSKIPAVNQDGVAKTELDQEISWRSEIEWKREDAQFESALDASNLEFDETRIGSADHYPEDVLEDDKSQLAELEEANRDQEETLNGEGDVKEEKEAHNVVHEPGLWKKHLWSLDDAAKEYERRTKRGPRRTTSHEDDKTIEKSSTWLRIATGLAFGAFALTLFALGTQYALILVALLCLLGVAEFYAALRKVGFYPATLLGIVASVASCVAAYLKGIQSLSSVTGLFALFCMVWYVTGSGQIRKERPLANAAVSILGYSWIGLLGSYGALILSPSEFGHGHGLTLLLIVVAMSVINDIGAFGVGSLTKRRPHLMAPRLSPAKTWEGFLGGSVATIIFGLIVGGLVSPWTERLSLICALVVCVASPLGDLAESMLKRDLNIKDFGTWLPGHGGMLDRVDGILFAMPACYYVFLVMHVATYGK